MKKIVQKMIKGKEGFTLIEIMVSISVFAIVLLISSGSIYTLFDTNRKSQNLRSVMDNLNYTLESMTRSIRFGSSYHCDVTITNPALNFPNDCGANGAPSIVFNDDLGNQIIYSTTTNSVIITKTMGGNTINLTSSDVTITNLKFYVVGSYPHCYLGCTPTDTIQPRVVIVLSGYVGTKPTTRSSFVLETTVSQRRVDAQ